MSKLPMETRPLRLAPEVQRIIESKLRPLNGPKLVAAQDAVLRVYQSGKQMTHEQWLDEYAAAIDTAAANTKDLKAAS